MLTPAFRQSPLPALPICSRMGMQVPDHTNRKNPGNGKRESQTVLCRV